MTSAVQSVQAFSLKLKPAAELKKFGLSLGFWTLRTLRYYSTHNLISKPHFHVYVLRIRHWSLWDENESCSFVNHVHYS